MPAKMPCRVIEVVKIRLIPIPNYNMLGGCEPWFRIQNEKYEYNSKVLYLNYLLEILQNQALQDRAVHRIQIGWCCLQRRCFITSI